MAEGREGVRKKAGDEGKEGGGAWFRATVNLRKLGGEGCRSFMGESKRKKLRGGKGR